MDNMVAQVEQCSTMMTYFGEMHHCGFEHYMTMHKEQHMVLDGLVYHGNRQLTDATLRLC